MVQKSAEQGYARAQCCLGFCYAKGYAVEQSYSKAVGWYHKSAEQGYARAQCNLGFCYEMVKVLSKVMKRLSVGIVSLLNKVMLELSSSMVYVLNMVKV